jgi:protein-tyrosine phosphatase
MYFKLTDSVWWGNWEAPFETLGMVNTIINVAHHFSIRRGRNIYWQKLQSLPHTIFYYRIALRDRDDIDEPYANALASAADAAKQAGKLPILTHCQMGGHRGPSSAIFVAWHLGGRKLSELEQLNQRALEL